VKRHVYVILRHDKFQGVDAPLTVRVAGTKAYFARRDAQTECERLQALNASKDCEYFVVLARLVETDEADQR